MQRSHGHVGVTVDVSHPSTETGMSTKPNMPPKCMILKAVSYLTPKHARELIETELETERQGRSV